MWLKRMERKKGQEAFYKSKRWLKCRAAYISEHPFCERCESRGIIRAADHVHHKKWLNEEDYSNPLVALNHDLLESLCIDCHNAEHHRKAECNDDLEFDKDGNLRQVGAGITDQKQASP